MEDVGIFWDHLRRLLPTLGMRPSDIPYWRELQPELRYMIRLLVEEWMKEEQQRARSGHK